MNRAGTVSGNFLDLTSLLTHAQFRPDIGLLRRAHSLYSKVRIGSYDIAAHSCAPAEVETLPVCLRA